MKKNKLFKSENNLTEKAASFFLTLTIALMLSSNKITFTVFCKHFLFFMTCKFIQTPPPIFFFFLLSNSNSAALTARQLSGGGQEVWGALFISSAGIASRL